MEGESGVPVVELRREEACASLCMPGAGVGGGYALTTAALSSRGFTSLGTALTSLHHVRTFDLRKNALTRVDASQWPSPSAACVVSLSGNAISRLCDFSALPYLQHLDLSHNALTRVGMPGPRMGTGASVAEGANEAAREQEDADAEIAEDGDSGGEEEAVAAASGVDVEADVPETERFVFAAPSVTTLYLTGNQLRSLRTLAGGPAFGRLARLEVCANGLQELALPPLPALRMLILVQNELTSLSGLGNAPALEVLNLDDNRLESLEDVCGIIRRWAPPATAGGSGSREEPPAGEVDDGSDSPGGANMAVPPLSRLRSLSVRNNGLLDNDWSFCSMLRHCNHLTALRIAGNPLADSVFVPREYDFPDAGDGHSAAGNGEEDEEKAAAEAALLEDYNGDALGEAVAMNDIGVPLVEPLGIKQEVLLRLPQLTSVDDDPITPGDRRAVARERKQRDAYDALIAKLEADAAAKRAAEAAATGVEAGEEGDEVGDEAYE